jgi:CBS domain-containing protein
MGIIGGGGEPAGSPDDGGGLAAGCWPGMLCGMQEIARLLAAHRPFDGLPPEVLEQTAATVEIAYFPRGSSILRQSGEPTRYLHVIVKGVVELRQADDRGVSELVETLAEGETFGQLSLLSRSPHLWDVVAREDVLAYLIPSEQVERLRQQPGFEALLARRAGDRLRRALAARREPLPLDLFSGRAGDLVGRPLVTCDPGETVTEAARRMRDQQVSSLVVRGRPPGLVTASDLRDRVLAAGRNAETPVAAVMTAPLQTMAAEATLGEVLLAMVDRGVHHLPLVREGQLVGMVTDTDLLRHESRHPLFVRRQLDRATGPQGLSAYAREVAAAAVRLIGAGSPAGDITRFLASAHDALYARVARDGEAALGPPPCPYALLVLGSGARREPTLRTDQDHALMLADDSPAGVGDWFAALAEQLAATLERCGLPRCPGGVMATNPARRVPRRAWQQQFGSWIQEPEEEALLEAAIFFDFRQLHGDLDAEAALRPVIRGAAGNRRFLGRLARAALRRRPPLGFLRRLRGDHQGRIDLKAHGTAPIVDLARLLALEADSAEMATVARLRAATERGTVGRTAADLAAAFEYLQEVRLRHQAGRVQAGAAPDDGVALADLGALERRWLKDAFGLLHTCQESVRIAFQTDLIA